MAHDPFALLARSEAYLVTEIPRRQDPHSPDAGERSTGRPALRQRAAALVAAYHAGVVSEQAGTAAQALAFGWIRTASGGPVRIVVAGDALAGSTAGNGSVLLSLPQGARGRQLPGGGFAGLAASLGWWREVSGISDGLLVAGSQEPGSRERAPQPGGLPLEDGLPGSWSGPFGWLVIAEPVTAARLSVLADEIGREQRRAEGMADRDPGEAAQVRRVKERHAEFQRGLAGGFWQIRVLAGGTDAASAARVAGLLCASTDLDGLPYKLSPLPPRDGPFYGSTELLAALAQMPESEIPGVRLTLRSEFDVTPETKDPGSSVALGDILDRNLMPAGSFGVSADSLNRHVFVCGATGGGKSQTVRSLLEAATGQRIPWLVVEPAKAEYRLMASRLPGTEVIRIRPGEVDAIAAGINPLEPAIAADGARFPLQTHADLVKALFIASFQAEEPFPQVLSAALIRVYEEAGWDLVLGEPAGGEARYPTLTALQCAAEQIVAEIGYSRRVTDDVLGFIRVRLASLRHGTTGRFLEDGHPLDFDALLRRNVVLEIEDVGDDADKAFLMGTVLIRLVEQLRLRHRAGTAPGLRHLTVIEEAHRLLRRSEPAGQQAGAGAASHAVELFAGLLAEIRAYGEGLVVAEQIPARLVPDVIKNTAVKIVHRLPAADDREAVGATMNATPAQSRYLVTLPPGQAAVFTDGMDFPILVQMRDGTAREAGGLAGPSDAGTVVAPRSATCGGECQARPCTLREMRAAERARDGHLWIQLWAELAVLAHLTGWPSPVPVPEVLATLRALPLRTVQCVISHAVDTAIAARPMIARQEALSTHISAVLTARAGRGEWLCRPDEPDWLLPRPITQDVVYGTVRPSAIEQIPALQGELDKFINCPWPQQFLITGDLRAVR